MSTSVTFRADYGDAKQADLLVLKTLAEQAEDSGMVFFSFEGLSDDTGYNPDIVEAIVMRQLAQGTLVMPTEGERLMEYYRRLLDGPFADSVKWSRTTPEDVLEDMQRNAYPCDCEYSVICLRLVRKGDEDSEE